MKKKSEGLKYKLISICTVVIVLTIWQLVTDVFKIVSPFMLPSPLKVLNTFIYKLTGGTTPDGANLIEHILSSLKIALGGYGVGVFIGVPLGIAMAWSRKFERYAMPLFNLIRPVPALAWIPLNSYTGIKKTNQVHLWVARTFGATNRQMLFKVAIPTALPMIFTGLRLALGSSWVALVAAEMLAATRGVGYMIYVGRMLGRPDIIIVGMITIGGIGLMMSYGLEKLQKKYIGRGSK